MTAFVLVDCCPVPSVLAPAVREAKRRSGEVLASCDRSPEAGPYLARCGKKTQAQLFWGWVHRLPGYNPANPPGRSTHERRNDGVFRRDLRVGAKIPDEEVGQDWSSGSAAARAYNDMGIPAALTYPGSPREAQHVNIRVTKSRWRWRSKPKVLKRGQRGPSVFVVVRRLQYCVRPHTGGKRYLPRKLGHSRLFFSRKVESAVRQFQHDHGLHADGMVGPKTAHQLAVSTAWWKRQRAHH